MPAVHCPPLPRPSLLQKPCILFIDEFDGLGKARQYGGMGNDESVHTINQLLTGGAGWLPCAACMVNNNTPKTPHACARERATTCTRRVGPACRQPLCPPRPPLLACRAEMDGFEDNTGVVVMAATNRPAALDQASRVQAAALPLPTCAAGCAAKLPHQALAPSPSGTALA